MQLRTGDVGPSAGWCATVQADAAITPGAGATAVATFALPGAELTDFVLVQNPITGGASDGLNIQAAQVTAPGVVSVSYHNPSAAPIGPTRPFAAIFLLKAANLSNS
jgi:hypothetical protein